MKSKLLLFPYDRESTPLLRCTMFLRKYDIIPCCLKGAGLSCGEDASVADAGEKVGITIINDFEAGLEEADEVLFVNANGKIIYDQIIYPKILRAIKKGKRVYDFVSKGEAVDTIRNQCYYDATKYYHVDQLDQELLFVENNRKIVIDEDYLDTAKLQGLADITTPVITVLGTSDNTRKFDMQVAVYCELLKLGYKVSWIGSKEYTCMVNGHRFPLSLIKQNYSEQEQILLFNRYIKNIEELEIPDVILIGVPGGIMPCNKIMTGDSGALAYKVCQSVPMDILVLSVFREEYLDVYFEEMELLTKYRFGHQADIINICNRQIEWTELEMALVKTVPFVTADLEEMKKYILRMQKLTNTAIMNVTDIENTKKKIKYILDILSEETLQMVF